MSQGCDDKNGWAARIAGCIRRYAVSADNRLHLDGSDEPAWEEPLVGFSCGGDPLYLQIKQDVGPFVWTPAEAFAAAFPDAGAVPGELTVIAWILPQTEKTRTDNGREKTLPSRRWALSRKYGEEFNVRLRDHVAAFLKEAGVAAAAPQNTPGWRQEKSERYSFASSWSERHAAYASGLGTFGLCDGLITPRGKAVRCGSVVARIALPATRRPYDDHHAYCLHYFDGSCGKCIKRCPADAVTRKGHDKQKCYNYLREVTMKYVGSRFGIDTTPCGLCQTAVPCEAKIPVPDQPR